MSYLCYCLGVSGDLAFGDTGYDDCNDGLRDRALPVIGVSIVTLIDVVWYR